MKRGVSRIVGLSDRCDDCDQVATTVLIVDDHPSFRATARALLEAEGYEVVGEAENGVSALRDARELHPDVILLDVQLPDFDGFEVASRLSENGDGPVIVMVSSRDASDFGPLVAQSGARGFIPKAELSGSALATLLG
jgi:DNA-binding NarL/FixJ family response regulator